MLVESSSEADVSRQPPPRWGFATAAGILGWVLDAFYFFVLIFLIDLLAQKFHVGKAAIIWSITVTLAMRPVGAFVFGVLADWHGRRRPLLACVIFYTVVTALTPFAPNYTWFMILRALYGIGMGGYWGVGTSLVMESAPRNLRGLFSGILQGGYPLGYLLAAVALRYIKPHFGWQSMFLSGIGCAVVIVVLTILAPESAAWELHRLPSVTHMFRTLGHHKRTFGYLLLVMLAMTCLSHGTQDLYPDFLMSVNHFSSNVISTVSILYNIGAIAGALLIGHLSERLGRRRTIMIALAISLISIPGWAFGMSFGALVAGSVVMQFGVQGAFGVIPAHLNELSPDSIRSLFPGFIYQLGVLLASPCVSAEYLLRYDLGYRWALTVFEGCVILSLFLIFGFGPERHGHDFFAPSSEEASI